MKKEYPNYLGKMREIENNLSEEDLKVLTEYLKFCSLSSGKEKTEQRKRYALQFLDIAEKPFNEFDREIIEHIYKLIKETKREITGKNEVIKQLKFFMRWLRDDENLIKGIKAIPQRKGFNTNKINPSTLITKDEIESLITACRSDPKKIAMISLQTELGLRPHELLALKWKDIKGLDSEEAEVKIFSNKTKETRVIPFITSIVPLRQWKETYTYKDVKDSDLIFPHPYLRKKPLYRTYLSQLYRELCKKAGIRSIYPYLARHTRMTEANKKMPSKVAAAYGGHSEKTASIYTHLSEDDIREIVLKQMYNIKEPQIKTNKQINKKIEETIKLLLEDIKLQKDVLKFLPNKKGIAEYKKKILKIHNKIEKLV